MAKVYPGYPTVALVGWTTDEDSTTQVEYGLTTSYGTITPLDSSGAFLRIAHSVSLSNLTSGTTYHYRMISKDARYNTVTSSDYTFTTPLALMPGTINLATISRNLSFGSTGDDVKQLQTLLVNEVGYSANLITGYFGNITREAVKKLQEKYNITPAFGYFGAITRQRLQALYLGR